MDYTVHGMLQARILDQAWKPSSQHAGEKRGVADLLLGRTERASSLGSRVEGLAVLLEWRGELGPYLGKGRCSGYRGEGLDARMAKRSALGSGASETRERGNRIREAVTLRQFCAYEALGRVSNPSVHWHPETQSLS